MSHADLEVVRVVCGCDFHCARSEFRVDVVIGNDNDLPIQERVWQRLADKVAVSLIVGMHGDGGVAEHRLQTSGRHHDMGLVITHRPVPERHQLTLDVFVFDLEV